MAGPAEILAAFRELSILKQITREELHGLLQDGIHAALAKKHGANVQAEVEIDEEKGKQEVEILALDGEEGAEVALVRDPKGREFQLPLVEVTQARLAFHWKR